MRPIATALVCSAILIQTWGTASAGCPSCGCESACRHTDRSAGHRPLIQIFGCCHHHGCHCCRDDNRRSRDAEPSSIARSIPVAPSGPIVESYPMMRAVPTMMAMPMMVGTPVRGVSLESQSRDLCDDRKQRDRLDDLDERVDALDLRMQTLQRAVELQTRILEEIKAQGTIGNQPIPSKSTPEAS